MWQTELGNGTETEVISWTLHSTASDKVKTIISSIWNCISHILWVMTLSYCNNNSSYPVWYFTSSAARMEPEWGQIQFRLNLNSLCICISHAFSKLSITVKGGATVHKCGVFVFGITSQFMRPELAFPFDNCYGKFLHRWLWCKDFTHGTRICPKWSLMVK